MLILVVEDDASVLRFISRGLREEGHTVDVCQDGEAAITQGALQPYDMILLDWTLPGQDGLSVLRAWRSRGVVSPVIMLTARDGQDAELLGLDAGADDYITKPFSFEILLARMRALLRRASSVQDQPLQQVQLGEAVLDLRARTIQRAGERYELSSREFALLDHLLKHRGEVVSRTRIMDRVWQVSFDTTTNIVDVYIRYLRQKLDEPGCASQDSLIETVRGKGYRLKAQEEL